MLVMVVYGSMLMLGLKLKLQIFKKYQDKSHKTAVSKYHNSVCDIFICKEKPYKGGNIMNEQLLTYFILLMVIIDMTAGFYVFRVK